MTWERSVELIETPLYYRAVERIELGGGDALSYEATHFSVANANTMFAELRDQLAFSQEAIMMFGRRVAEPRLSAWYGDRGAHYRYSGTTRVPIPWLPVLSAIRDRVEKAAGTSFNGCLANLYRNGNDSMGWHADDEPELGPTPVVASISFGAERALRLRPKGGGAACSQLLAHGSLLIMEPGIQARWQHQIAKSKRVTAERISLTFRHIITPRPLR